MTKVYLSLGSNMGNRQDYLQKAVEAIKKLTDTEVEAVSSYYETAAWGLTDQADFLNLAIALETQLSVESLLSACQAIEKDLDRVRHEHWGPRTVDIDILLYGQETWGTEHLKVPHPFMTQRAFVLVPLLEIAEDLVEPQTGQPYEKYLSQLDTSDVRKLEQVD
ncbi:2-amino-4-hydroxy-6-hydroxymethyldihydropteridine diphosphokinase [Streptococcus vestibularis]|uniref:2-amino-4-hydroxy-6- hydroxymethyldihydropteridine diphosphokinase n=1 Tax=Streptococcus vestibularis TaxID=1343 RepID=UPI00232C0CEC|nr:2-amino-4-hydroxy-6-hydroxymethyldihydropteridine diphosphokinase [Streptococcus vestibularis]MDB6184922.1 2-amino-4-hydroxy-6-hydroxymethyldihydropteridine diphosphokinase [Streptococcus vestibularis]MDB6202209.1 2-amino-4-hydroxy-6-hydroxymethyldihydropteridine diphosphokinase [Streptococcus vestibularis]MDB6208334.1 2-amino-4-hydroxy-6-hydroxymethyldihydropteridine diphosphokinase [Streptococcus vestibularis]MDB6211741.1 2-amino-4-hydroxy-6-hydroxymethyldihydropteridine diphosphokinase [S